MVYEPDIWFTSEMYFGKRTDSLVSFMDLEVSYDRRNYKAMQGMLQQCTIQGLLTEVIII